MKLSRRSALALAGGALASPLMRGAGIASAQGLTSIKAAGVPEDSAVPVLWGIQSGIFRRHGLDVSLEAARSGAAIAASVAGGAYQIGKSSLAALIAAHVHGVPFVLIAPAAIYDSSISTVALLVKADSPMRVPADLNGKTIAVSSINDVYEIATKAWVDQHGGDSSTMKFVELPVTAVAEAVATGRVDAAGIAVPELQQTLATGRTRVIGHMYDGIAPRFLIQGWFTTADYANKNPEIVRAFARGEREGAIYANGHHQQIIDSEAQFTKIEPGVIAKMTHFFYATSLEPAMIQPLIDATAKYKVIPASFDAREMIASVLR